MSKDKDWVVYGVIYQMPKFGTENEFLPEHRQFMVSTAGGVEDARAAFEKYHPGCKEVAILSGSAKILYDKGDTSVLDIMLRSKDGNGTRKTKGKAKK